MSKVPSQESRSRLVAEYQRRAKIVADACERSNQMERDFLAKKVLNAEANEALEDFGRKRAAFGEWLLQVSDELFSLARSETEERNPEQRHSGGVAELVERQIYDPALWVVANTAPEAYLQRALRELHAAIEGEELVWKVTPGRPPVVPDSRSDKQLDTPRTDEAEVYYSEIVTGRDGGMYWVKADFARQLEREVNALHAQIRLMDGEGKHYAAPDAGGPSGREVPAAAPVAAPKLTAAERNALRKAAGFALAGEWPFHDIKTETLERAMEKI